MNVETDKYLVCGKQNNEHQTNNVQSNEASDFNHY
jgi:hypothetical protein